MGQGGVVHLWVVAVDLIHPALTDYGMEGGKEFSLILNQNLLSQHIHTSDSLSNTKDLVLWVYSTKALCFLQELHS